MWWLYGSYVYTKSKIVGRARARNQLIEQREIPPAEQ